MIIFLASFFLFLFLGVHVGVALASAGVIYYVLATDYSLMFLPQSFLVYMHGYALMAIPFFILAGFLMERTGLIKQIFVFAEHLLKGLPAGLGVAAMVTCMVFASITGSSVAMAAAMTVIAIPLMRQRGYPDSLSSGIVCSGGTLGLLIPPSLTLIVYGVMTETSIFMLFMAGLVPGVALGILLSIIIVIIGLKQGFRSEPAPLKPIARSFVKALGGLLFPVLVLGGLYGGVFTPTEAGAAACGYALLYGLITSRVKFLKELPDILRNALQLTAVVFFLLGGAGIFATVSAYEYLPQKLTEIIIAMGLTPVVFLVLYMAALLVLGCFLDALSMIILTIPVAFPVALALGIDPIHLGILTTINAEMATITPPVGFNLYAVSGLGKIPISTVLRGVAPFFVMIFAFLIFVLYVPEIALWFPDMIRPEIVWGG